ncbi:MAG: NAD(P)-dependent oxidoreductase [Jatrophihabitantaceae bacterium]
MRPNVVLLGAMYDPAGPELLAEHATLHPVAEDDPAGLADALSQAHGLIARYPSRIDRQTFAAAPQLFAVLSSGRGVDNIDLPAATAAGVAVANNPGLGAQPVSEHALGLMISISRDLTAVARDGLAIAWDRRVSTRRVELGGSVLGIVGCGFVGSAVAHRASAGFGMRVLAYDPYVPAERMAAVGATKVDTLPELLAQADFVTAHPELNAETLHMFDSTAFGQLKPGAYFVNTSRGRVVDTDALVRALRSGRLAGAAIDVYEDEPPPLDSPLLDVPGLMLTAHVADFTVQTKRALALSAAGQLVTALGGQRPPHLLNPEVWTRVAERAQAINEHSRA